MNLTGIKLKHKKIALSVAVVVVLLATLVGLGWLRFDDGTDTSDKFLSMDEALAIAMSYSDKGDIKGGLGFYDDQIRERKDSNEKQQLFLYKSDFALRAGKYDDAVSAAKAADGLKSNIASMTTLARAYEGKGDKRQAASYYKKLLEASPKDGLGSRYSNEWKQKIEELES